MLGVENLNINSFLTLKNGHTRVIESMMDLKFTAAFLSSLQSASQ